MNNSLISKLKGIDDYISYVNIQLDYTKYLTPINLKEENTKFIEKYRNNQRYNPIYCYKPYGNIDFEKLKKDINEYQLSDSPIERIFKRYLIYLIKLTNFYQNRCNYLNYTKYSIESFGFPNDDLVKNAYSFLTSNQAVDNQEDKHFNASSLSKKLQNQLNSYGYKWKIVVLESSTTKVTVDPEKKIIYLNGSQKFSENDLDRLKVHEIDTHVLRSENGSMQPFKIFSTGLANSLATEEGIAVVSEEKNNVLNNNTLRLYAGRVIAVALSKQKSFYEIFIELLNYFNEQDSLYITQRVKKGLEDTSQAGGFTKDYVYYYGYIRLKQYFQKLKNQNNKALFVGSVGLEDLEDIDILLKSGLLREPDIMPKTYL